MPSPCCTRVAPAGTVQFIDAIGEPQDGEGNPVDPEDAVQLEWDGVVYTLQPGDVFLVTEPTSDGDNLALSLWVVSS